MPFHENRPVAKRSILRQNKCDLTAAEWKRLAISGLQAVQIFQDPGNCSVTKPSRRFNVFTGCLLLERILKDSQERRVQFLELIGALAAEPMRESPLSGNSEIPGAFGSDHVGNDNWAAECLEKFQFIRAGQTDQWAGIGHDDRYRLFPPGVHCLDYRSRRSERTASTERISRSVNSARIWTPLERHA